MHWRFFGWKKHRKSRSAATSTKIESGCSYRVPPTSGRSVFAVRNGHRVFKNFWKVDLAQDFVSLPKDVQSDWSISPVVILELSFVKFTQELR